MPIHSNAEEMKKTEALCTEEHAPRCRAACPLHIDGREICRLLREGNLPKAREVYASAALLPRITARLCDGPCRARCRRGDVDAGVNLGALERYLCADPAWVQRPLSIRFPNRYRAAIVGAGVSGLSAAAYLAARGFQVTVYEKESCPGPLLMGQNGLTQGEVTQDIAPFGHLVTWRFGQNVGVTLSHDALAESHDAVLYTGAGPDTVEALPDPFTLRIGESKLCFAGRKLLGNPTLAESLCSGKRAAITMERLMKRLSLTAMRVHEDSYETELYTSIDGVSTLPAIPENGGYSKEDATSEANRCLDCHCLVCVRECAFMQKFNRFPRLYIREIANTISLLRDGIRSGKNLLTACSQCGLCGKLCPNGVSMAEVARLGKAAMVEKGELSPAIYDFPVRDMLFSNGEQASLCRHAPGKSRSKLAFFPGCQLAAAAPETVLQTYAHLLKLEPETGLLLGCCGAPADWSGRERLYEETVSALQEKLASLGNPRLVCACPTCYAQLKAAGVDVLSLYPLLERGPLPEKARHPQPVAVHDSCAARDDLPTQRAIRSLLEKCGYQVQELPMSGEKTKCCGYGGLVFYGDREVAQRMIAARAEESPLPYVAYCSVCRDYLARAGKPALHLLEALFGKDDPAAWTKRGATVSEKEDNRLRLFEEALRRFFGEERSVSQTAQMELRMDDRVRLLLDDRLIRERTVRAVIAAAQDSGKRLVRPSDGHYIASLRPGIITYWVEYAPEGTGYRIYNAYSHRVDIGEAKP